jgi:murein DD-endopeptidase MepM/ murein hydrolase activator NlpD
VAQGSPVHALAEGIVFAVKDGGKTGYSYILIGHRNGYASLYGHVSLAMVKTGDVVRFGQTIALSGGQPGTHGAGHMTTGPHLHLEIMKDGEHVNPLSVLPK